MACPTTGTCLIPAVPAGLTTVDVGPPVTGSSVRDLAGKTQLTGLACPSASLCLGVDHAGAILRTTRPAGPSGGWQRTVQPKPQALAGVSCPSVSFCAAAGANDTVLTTSSPGSAAVWRRTRLKLTYEIDSQDPPGPFPYNLEAISCPSRRLCVAGTDYQGVIVSTHPTVGRSAWRDLQLTDGAQQAFDAVSCPTTSLCVAGDDSYGQVAVSTRPASGARAWHSTRIVARGGQSAGVLSVSCPTARFCLAGDSQGAIHWTTRPTGGVRAWHRVKLGTDRLVGAFCRSRRFCVVIGHREAFATTRPTGPSRAWHRVALPADRFHLGTPGDERLLALTCAPTRLCLAANGTGSVFPGAGRSSSAPGLGLG